MDDAQDFLAYLRLAKRRGVLADLNRGRVPLSEFFELEYWSKDARRNLALATRKSYLSVWYVHLKPRIGHLPLREITPPVVQMLREQMEEDDVGTSTTKRAMAILQAVCRHALARGEIASNPVKEVRKPTVRRTLAVAAIAPAQVEALLALLRDGYVELRVRKDGTLNAVHRPPDPLSAMLVTLLAYEGLRPEEALALEDRHVGKSTLLIEQKNIDGHIEPGQKTGKPPRSPDLWLPVRTDLAAYRLCTRRSVSSDGRQLLIPRTDGEPWREHDYRNWRRRVFRPAVAAAALPITRPYDLRHACASLMIHAGQPLTEIAEHLGNSVGVLSKTYLHVIKDMKGERTTSVPDAIISARADSRSKTA